MFKTSWNSIVRTVDYFFQPTSGVCNIFFCFKNAGNIQRPTLKAVEYSFNQGQANKISDMQLFVTNGTVNKNNITKKTQKYQQQPTVANLCLGGKMLRQHEIQRVNRTKLKDIWWQEDKGPHLSSCTNKQKGNTGWRAMRGGVDVLGLCLIWFGLNGIKRVWLILVTHWWRSCTWETCYYGTRWN